MALGVSTSIAKVSLRLRTPLLSLTVRGDDGLLYCELSGDLLEV